MTGKGNFGNGKLRFEKDEIPRNKKWENYEIRGRAGKTRWALKYIEK